MIKNKTKKTLLVFSMLLLGSSYNTFAVPAHSAISSGTIAANGSVAGTCSVTATDFAFGVLTSGGVSKTSTLTATCTDGTNYKITNSSNTNNLYLNNAITETATSIIAFPITVTTGGEAFTLSNATLGYVGGIGTGGADVVSSTLTATSADSTGKTQGSYSGTVILTVTY
jgi:spore coat protein U-like protein